MLSFVLRIWTNTQRRLVDGIVDNIHFDEDAKLYVDWLVSHLNIQCTHVDADWFTPFGDDTHLDADSKLASLYVMLNYTQTAKTRRQQFVG